MNQIMYFSKMKKKLFLEFNNTELYNLLWFLVISYLPEDVQDYD